MGKPSPVVAGEVGLHAAGKGEQLFGRDGEHAVGLPGGGVDDLEPAQERSM
jgi:hypothetical protein